LPEGRVYKGWFKRYSRKGTQILGWKRYENQKNCRYQRISLQTRRHIVLCVALFLAKAPTVRWLPRMNARKLSAQLTFFVDHVLTNHRVVLLDFQLSRGILPVLRSRIKVTCSRWRNKLNFFAHRFASPASVSRRTYAENVRRVLLNPQVFAGRSKKDGLRKKFLHVFQSGQLRRSSLLFRSSPLKKYRFLRLCCYRRKQQDDIQDGCLVSFFCRKIIVKGYFPRKCEPLQPFSYVDAIGIDLSGGISGSRSCEESNNVSIAPLVTEW